MHRCTCRCNAHFWHAITFLNIAFHYLKLEIHPNLAYLERGHLHLKAEKMIHFKQIFFSLFL